MIMDLDAWTFLTYRVAALLKILSHILSIKTLIVWGAKMLSIFGNIRHLFVTDSYPCL